MYKKETWDDGSTNAEQQYASHGVFRYFGKLPPTLTSTILDQVGVRKGVNLTDVMCGSGTTLIEGGLRGANTWGIDCNPASVLISKVKTTALPTDAWMPVLEEFRTLFSDVMFAGHRADGTNGNLCFQFSDEPIRKPRLELPEIPNFGHWFDDDIAQDLAQVSAWVGHMREGPVRDLAQVAFLACVRPCSRASVRIGRLFRDADKIAPNPYAEFAKRFEKCGLAASALNADERWHNSRVAVSVGDAKATEIGRAHV